MFALKPIVNLGEQMREREREKQQTDRTKQAGIIYFNKQNG